MYVFHPMLARAIGMVKTIKRLEVHVRSSLIALD